MTETSKTRAWGGVKAGQKAVLDLPIGNTYHGILTQFSGVTLDQLGRVVLKVNGDELDTYDSAEQLVAFNDYRGISKTADILELNFERSELLEREFRELSAIGTGIENDPREIETLSLEIDIDAAAAAPVLESWAVTSPPSVSGIMRQTRHFNYDILQTGDYEIYDIPRGSVIDQIFFKATDPATGAAVDLNSISLKENKTITFERTRKINEHIQRNGVRVPQAGYVVFDPSEMGYGTEGLVTNGLQELRWIINTPAACRLRVSVAYMAPIEQKIAVV